MTSTLFLAISARRSSSRSIDHGVGSLCHSTGLGNTVEGEADDDKRASKRSQAGCAKVAKSSPTGLPRHRGSLVGASLRQPVASMAVADDEDQDRQPLQRAGDDRHQDKPPPQALMGPGHRAT